MTIDPADDKPVAPEDREDGGDDEVVEPDARPSANYIVTTGWV